MKRGEDREEKIKAATYYFFGLLGLLITPTIR